MLLTVLTFALLSTLDNSKAQQSKDTSTVTYRLPRAIRPDHYNLRVLTYLGDSQGFVFRGRVTIQMACLEDTFNVTLHSNNLSLAEKDIKLVQLSDSGSSSVQLKQIQYMADYDYVVFHTATKLGQGSRYELMIPFKGVLRTGSRGYFRSSYVDRQRNATVWISATNFKPTFARRAFPCFDEPDLKATFNVSLGHHKRFSAQSNMPLSRTESMVSKRDWVIDHFQQTVPMSTYLVAYSVNDFVYREVKDNVEFRVWVRRDAMDQLDYAVDLVPRAIRFYEELLAQKYPLPKMDLIAIPDYAKDGMAGWGMLMLRESLVLYHKSISTTSNKHEVAFRVAKLVAHQWFGNMVTMAWWSQVWMNEGMAYFITRLGVEHLHPEWNSLEEDTFGDTTDVFELDTFINSHPEAKDVTSIDEILELIDDISSLKASAIINMMANFLGADAFWSGIKLYLERHKYSNVEHNDLWAALSETSQQNGALPENTELKQVMESWTLQTGVPIVTVTRNYESNSADVTQMRYLAVPYFASNASSNCWWIPLTYTTQEDSNYPEKLVKDWMTCNSSESPTKTITNLPDKDRWVIFNVQLVGFYWVHYDAHNYKLLVQQLHGEDYQRIGVADRSQLADEALDLAWIKVLDIKTAFAMVNYLRQETEYLPWVAALKDLRYIDNILKPSPVYQNFQNYIRFLLEPNYERLQIFNENRYVSNAMSARKLRSLIASWACEFNVGDCSDQSMAVFTDWMSTENPDLENPIPRDLRSAVYCTAIAQGNVTEWDFLMRQFHASNVASERELILQSLACTRTEDLLQRFLDSSIDSRSGIRKQNAPLVFEAVAKNDVGLPLAYKFLQDNVRKIYNYFLPDPWSSERYLNPIVEMITTRDKLQELADFIAREPRFFEATSKAVRQALEAAELNIAWMSTNYEPVAQLLPELINCNMKSCLEFF